MKFYVKKWPILKNGSHFEIYLANGIFHKDDPRGSISHILVLLSRFKRFCCLSAVLHGMFIHLLIMLHWALEVWQSQHGCAACYWSVKTKNPCTKSRPLYNQDSKGQITRRNCDSWPPDVTPTLPLLRIRPRLNIFIFMSVWCFFFFFFW